MATIRITALRPINLPHRKLEAGEAIDFARKDDLSFFLSRLRWSAFKVEAIDAGPATRSEIDATCHKALREAGDALKAALAENAALKERLAELESRTATAAPASPAALAARRR